MSPVGYSRFLEYLPGNRLLQRANGLLQLAEGSGSRFVEGVDKAKDAIGEWHEWTELEALAGKVLDTAQVVICSKKFTPERACPPSLPTKDA